MALEKATCVRKNLPSPPATFLGKQANGVPVIVPSDNDGCAVTRSEEAKRLGVEMGMPWFQIRKDLGDAGIVALSANFALYGDLSNRMMSVAAGLGPAQEIYSIDESFISLTGMPGASESVRPRHWPSNLVTMAPAELRGVLAATDPGEVWGVGSRLTEQLKSAGTAS